MEIILAYCTFPNEEIALEISNNLLKDKLIACYNLDTIKSGYIWEANLVNEMEVRVIFKTSTQNRINLIKKIEEIHPYKTPCILTFVVQSNQGFADWIISQTNQ
jgi:periplasmic divalent cation tolerance protein